MKTYKINENYEIVKRHSHAYDLYERGLKVNTYKRLKYAKEIAIILIERENENK